MANIYEVTEAQSKGLCYVRDAGSKSANNREIAYLQVEVGGTGTSAQQIQGTAADGVAASGNPIQVGGKDGSNNIQTISTDVNGIVNTHDSGVNNTLNDISNRTPSLGQNTSSNSVPVVIASDQSSILVSQGTLGSASSAAWYTQGSDATAAAIVGNPYVIAGSNGGNVKLISVDGDGNLQVDINNIPAVTISGIVQTTPAFNFRADTYITTGNGTTINASTAPIKQFAVQVKGTGAGAGAWDVRLEGSLDGTNFTQIIQHTNVDTDGAVKWQVAGISSPILYFRSRCAGLTLGGATNIVVTILGMD